MAMTTQETNIPTAVPAPPPVFPEALPERVPISRTVLAPILEGLPWDQDAFILGHGLDAVTGLTASETALVPFTPEPVTETASAESYRFIQTPDELAREIESAASGKYNLWNLKTGPATEYLTAVRFSEMGMTLVAHYDSVCTGYDRPEIYELTPEARKAASDPAGFRGRFGDYFVAGVLRGSRFTAVYQCQAATHVAIEKLRAAFGGEPPRVLTREGAEDFRRMASLYGVEVMVNVFFQGCAPRGGLVLPPYQTNPEEALSELSWFKSHAEPVPVKAELRHFSALAPELPRHVGAAPEAFTGLGTLYTDLWKARARFGTCPDPYRRQLEEHFVHLAAGIGADQGVLATDPDKRSRYQRETGRMAAELQEVFDRMDFYAKVKARMKDEPHKDEPLEDVPGGPDTWSFGFEDYPQSRAVVLHRTDLRFSKSWLLGGWREHTFAFGPEKGYLIVGWKVTANRTDDHDGSWWKASDQILLTHEARVHVKSQYDRGCDWCLTVYYVNTADYLF